MPEFSEETCSMILMGYNKTLHLAFCKGSDPGLATKI